MTKTNGRQGGFALVIALSLMAFILLLLLSISTLVRVEMSSSVERQSVMSARQNALLGLQEALGQLQLATGPDQRVTVTGSLWQSPEIGTEHYVGVWDSEDRDGDGLGDGEFLGWLVSRKKSSDSKAITLVNSPQAIQQIDGTYSATSDDVALVLGSGSVTADSNRPNVMQGVVAEKRDVMQGTNQTVGHYAWWVGDEGVKARINLIDPASQTASGATSEFELKRASSLSMPRFAIESMETLDFIDSNEPQLKKSISEDQLSTLYPANSAEIRSRFHDTTLWSSGVQSDVREGGLKKDLSLLFELSEANWRDTPFYSNSQTIYTNAPVVGDVSLLFSPSNGDKVDGATLNIPYGDKRLYGPSWDKLRDYYRLYKAVGNRRTQPEIDARAAYPGTADMSYGTHQKNWSMGISRQGFRRFLGDNDPFMSKVSSGSSGFGASSSFPFVRTTRSPVSPYLSRLLIQVYAEVAQISPTEYEASLVILPVVIFHNPYNVTLNMAETRFVWSMNQHSWFYQFGSGPVIETEMATAVGDGNALIFTSNSFGEAEFTLSPQSFEPGQVRAFVAENSNWNANSPVPLKGVSGINNAYQGDGLRLPPVTISSVTDATEIFRALYSTFAHQLFGIEMRDAEDPNDYDTMLAVQSFGTEQLRGFNWFARQSLRNDPSDLDKVQGFPLDQMVDTRTAITTFDFYVKPVEIDYETIPGSSAASGVLPFPSFVSSNPLSPSEQQLSAAGQGSPFLSPLRVGYVSDGNIDDLIITDAIDGSGNGFWGAGISNSSSGSTSVSILEVPTVPMQSLGQLQHVNLVEQPHYPALAIGNSFSTPFLNDNSQLIHTYNISGTTFGPGDKVFFDLSYFANRALWDGYFFSSIAPLDSSLTYSDPNDTVDGEISPMLDAFIAGDRSLYNPRMRLHHSEDESPSDVKDTLSNYKTSASKLMVDGAFNVNSTSVEAWTAFLGGLRDASIYTNENGLSEIVLDDPASFLRQSVPNGPADRNSNYSSGTAWAGFAALSQNELESLATQIVDQIHQRSLLSSSAPTPFLSLAQFVNRSLRGGDLMTGGALQKAIEASDVNDNFSTAAEFNANDYNSNFSSLTYAGAAEAFENQDFTLNVASAAPTNLLQSDVLQMLAPYLSVRSDTFRIRSYGEAVDSVTNEVTGKVWCEAIVQRVPDPVYPSASNATEPDPNIGFGRKYRILKFRWLNEDEV